MLSRVSNRGTWINSAVVQDDQSRGHLDKQQKDFQKGNQDSEGVQKRTSRQEVERLNRSQTEDFQEGSRETQRSRKKSSEMVMNGLRDQDRLDGASNFVV